MMLELNDVLIEDAEKTVSLMAREGNVTCLTGGSDSLRKKLLLAILGLEPIKSGFVSIDGEPLTPQTVSILRHLMTYAPAELEAEGEVIVYAPPSVQNVFELKDNRDAEISNGIFDEEMKRTGASEKKARLLATAVLRKRPVLLVDQPDALSADYLRSQAKGGRIVLVCSDEREILDMSDEIIQL